jgi:hypothetical protein
LKSALADPDGIVAATGMYLGVPVISRDGWIRSVIGEDNLNAGSRIDKALC